MRAALEMYVDGFDGPASGGSDALGGEPYEGRFVVERIGELGGYDIWGTDRSKGMFRAPVSLDGASDAAEEKPLSFDRRDFGRTSSFEEVFCFGLVRSLNILISCPSNRAATLVVLVSRVALGFPFPDVASDTFELDGMFECEDFWERSSLGIVVLEAAKKPLTVPLGASGKATPFS